MTSPARVSSATSREGKKGGNLLVLAAGDVDYVDPGRVYYAFGYTVHYPVNRTLYSYGPGDNEKPRADLAVGDPEVSADKKTVTVKIKSGVRFRAAREPRAQRGRRQVRVRAGVQRARALELCRHLLQGH